MNRKSALKRSKTARMTDYEALSKYILEINRQKDINGILLEVSRCLKDLLNYELFGFALRRGGLMDIWIDPRSCRVAFAKRVSLDFNCQNIDHNLHSLGPQRDEKSHNFDSSGLHQLISFTVLEKTARLYLIPGRDILSCADSILPMIVSSIAIAVEKSLNMEQLEKAAAVDPLTNCYNRRGLVRLLERDVASAKRFRKDLSIVMIDLDNFKEVNDGLGHHTGDAVLEHMGLLLQSMIRKSDYAARYGGEEFLLVLPETALYQAVQLAERIRKRIAGHEVRVPGACVTLSASFGVASLENKQEIGSLVREADERLYQAKFSGKNAVIPTLLPCFGDRNFVAGKGRPNGTEAWNEGTFSPD